MQDNKITGDQVPSTRTQTIVFVFLAAVLILAFFGYRQGLPGSFMFDDYPNLQTLSNYGGVTNLTTLKLYLDDQFAGPTGRPISMLSFLIDVHDWPADPGATKFKNVLIHILNGLMLFWLLTASLRQSFLSQRPQEVLWIATLATAWWVLHPLHVSTVLYAIQRMAELATLFTLLGLAGYVAGRKRLETHPRQAYGIMAGSLVIGTVLAVLSKENGALLPLLALVLEGTILASGNRPAPARLFRSVFLWLPSAMVIGYVAYSGLTSSATRAQMRGFTVYERLLTESRVLFDYLRHLFMPSPQTGGIFRDSLTISTSPIAPLTTLFALLGIAALLGLAFAVRRKAPLLSAAVLFYFAGHIIESTAVSLEPYFEHRNYLPSVLLFLPVAQVLVWAGRIAPKPAIAGALAITLIFTGTLWARADLWSDRTNLYITWANQNPGSPRAQLSAVNVLQQAGATDAAIDRLRRATERNPRSLALQAHLVRLAAGTGTLEPDEFKNLQDLAGSAAFEGEAVVALRRLAQEASAADSSIITRRGLVALWRNLQNNDNYMASTSLRVLVAHELGSLYARMRNGELAVRHFNRALEESRSVETGMMQAAILATNRYHCAALDQLAQAEELLAHDPEIQRNREYFAREIDRIRSLITGEAENAGKDCAPPDTHGGD